MRRRHGQRRVWTALVLAVGVALSLTAGAGEIGAATGQPVVLVADDHTSLHETISFYMGRLCPTKYGLSIQHVQVARYADAIILAQKTDVHFAIGGYSTLASIAENNIPVIAIAGVMMKAYGLVVRKGVEIKTWKDLEGKKVAVPANSIIEHHVRVGARERGVDTSKINFVTMVPGPQALIALQRGDIDAASLWEPWFSKALTDGIGTSPFDESDNSIGPLNGIVQSNPEWLKKNKDLVVRYLKCLIEAGEYLNSHPDEHAKIATQWVAVDLPAAQASVKTFTYDYRIYEPNAIKYAADLYQFGLTKTDTSSKIPSTIDYSYLQAATGKLPEQLGKSGYHSTK
jgi:ABC-type nitrate/sulfonate/bicarbonate transport system substrate-binding protein